MLETSFPLNTPNAGNKTRGNNEVTPKGKASVTHQKATSSVMARVAAISGVPPISTKNRVAIKRAIPKVMYL